jgi:hypothetical protein
MNSFVPTMSPSIFVTSLVLLAPGITIAQPVAPSAVAMETAAIDSGLWMDGVRAAYVAEPVHERHEISFTTPGGESMSAAVLLRSEHRGAISRLFMQLGTLDVLVEANRIGIVHRHNPRTILLASATPEQASGLDTLLSVVPPIPLPQLAWALDHRSVYGNQLNELAGLSPWLDDVQIATVIVDSRGAAIGGDSAPDSSPNVQMIVGPSNRVRIFRSRLRTPDGETVELNIESHAVAPLPLPTWEQFIGQREPVALVSQLRPAPSQIVTGSLLPSLGLMNQQMASWDLTAFLRTAAQSSAADVHLTAILLYQATEPEAREDALSGLQATRLAARELRQRSALKEITSTRLSILPVGVLSIDDFRSERLEQFAREWTTGRSGTTPGEGELVWTTIGPEAIERFVPLSAAVIVIVDESTKVVGVLPLDQRRGDPQALQAELLDALANK